MEQNEMKIERMRMWLKRLNMKKAPETSGAKFRTFRPFPQKALIWLMG
jgi:hypothetical protein